MNYIYGINAVAEALKARGRSFEWVGVLKERHDLRLQRVVEECRRNGVAVRFLGRPELDRMAGNNAHQGVVAITSAKQYNDLDDVVAAKRGQYSLIVVLDGIEDPHNLGAILRTADASGRRRSGDPGAARGRSDRDCDQSFRRRQRASSHRQSHQHCAHAGRIERKKSLDRWAG